MEIIPKETIPVMETILILAILILHSIHHTMEVMKAQMVHIILHIMESMMRDPIMVDVMAHIMRDPIMEVTIKKVKINRNLDSYKELKASSIMTNLRLQEF